MKHLMVTLIAWLSLSLLPSHLFAKEFNSDSTKKTEKNVQTMTGNERSATKPRYEGTICFSYLAGDTQELDGGKCDKKTTNQMYEEGWRLVQVITGLSKMGFLFERPIK